ncbi:hypothetical protein V5O48_005029 [Marasmius crinis-equi]|uniref:Uncharacterized protein n=1 Tax=Marasmius crinis-equi TaxID=585013 RepID=A0ABR3FNP9_9AGAR
MKGSNSPPDSPLTMTSSLEHATSTIDDLTLALANFSRLPSPDPLESLTCCCKREGCENLQAWHALKSRLESRLTLSAEIGQALLQRSEAFSRRNEVLSSRRSQSDTKDEEDISEDDSDLQDDEFRISQLTKEKTELERRLTQALVNTEVTEVSNKTILQELQEAKLTISRLSSHHARSVGWETRLSVATKERDDMQQERDFESQRARLAESRFVALKDKTCALSADAPVISFLTEATLANLQAEVRRLQDELQEKRAHRLEASESILQDVRSQIQTLHRTLGDAPAADSTELTRIMESLVDDNEALKKDNTELQTLLAQSRDDMYGLQQELEEQRALGVPRSRAATPLSPHSGVTPHMSRHVYSGSMPSSLIREHLTPILSRREPSVERKSQHRSFEPLTPETTTLPLSPADSTFSRQPPSPYVVEDQDEDTQALFPEKPRTHKPLFLLTRSRGVQTEESPTLLAPSPAPTPSPYDLRSESSSYSESVPSTMSTLVDRVTALLQRMSEADALTLTNRLKRQHLRGADVGHLSRSTVSNILNEVTGLRAQFRFLLEDEKLVTTCTRKDMRAIFKLFREIFAEMGQMRVTLNDIILDPSIAPKVSELALDPKKAEASAAAAAAEGNSGTAGWIAPISKLFGSPAARVESGTTTGGAPGLTRAPSSKGNARPPRFVPKIAPATSASATTVNVEFSGSGRATTSTSGVGTPSRGNQDTLKRPAPQPSTTPASSSNVMGIFAGAPRPTTPDRDPWVVLPRQPRRVQSTLHPSDAFTPANTIRANALQSGEEASRNKRLSRNVDAIIDSDRNRPPNLESEEEDEAPDYVAPLLERTLRRRGLSDSSIHSTFMSGQGDTSMSSDTTMSGESSAWPSKGSVLQALSKKVQNFRMGVAATPSSSYKEGSPIGAGRRPEGDVGVRSVPGLSSFITSWAGAGPSVDPTLQRQGSLLIGSPPRDDLLGRAMGSRAGEDAFY